MLRNRLNLNLLLRNVYDCRIIKFRRFNSSVYETNKENFGLDSPYFKEKTDKIYPKIPHFHKTITSDDILLEMSKLEILFKNEQFNEAFITANNLLINTILLNDDTQNQNQNVIIILYNILGNIHFNLKDYQSAIEKFLMCLDKFILVKEKNSQQFIEYAKDSIFRIAISYFNMKSFSESNKYLYSLLYKFNLNSVDPYYLKVVNLIFKNYYQEKNFEETLKFYKTISLDLDRSIETEPDLEIYFYLGDSLYENKEYDQSVKYLLKFYQYRHGDGNKTKINSEEDFDEFYIHCLNKLAQVYLKLANYNESINYCKKLEKIVNKESKVKLITSKNLLFFIYDMMSTNYKLLHDYENSIKYLTKSIDKFREYQNDPEFSINGLFNISYSNLFSILLNQNNNHNKNSYQFQSDEIHKLFPYLEYYLECNLFTDIENDEILNKFHYVISLINNYCYNYHQFLNNEEIDFISKSMNKFLFLLNMYERKDLKLETSILIFISTLFRLKKDYINSLDFAKKSLKYFFQFENNKLNFIDNSYDSNLFLIIKDIVMNFKQLYIENNDQMIKDILNDIINEILNFTFTIQNSESNIQDLKNFLIQIKVK